MTTFLDQLRASRLLTEDQLADVSQRFSAGESVDLATALVDEGWLTSFQAEKVQAGKGKGLLLGQYRLLDEVGKGGFGCVYRARHEIMNRIVAVKVIAPERFEDERARRAFRREVLAATRLIHPNIVMAFDANEVDDTLFLVMEYVDGVNLDQLVRRSGPLPIHLACAMLQQAAQGLHYAHQQSLVHRDIKPGNLLVPRSMPGGLSPGTRQSKGRQECLPHGADVLLKIADFGLARLLQDGETGHTQSRDKGFVGKPDYVSPEQARNGQAVDIRSDLYGLGCSFYFALTGQRPFQGKTALEIVVQHLEKTPPSLEARRPEIPVALASIIRRLMAKDPQKRFQNPVELIAELDFLLTAPGGPLGMVAPALDASGTEAPAEETPAEEGALPQTRVVPEGGGRGPVGEAPAVRSAHALPIDMSVQHRQHAHPLRPQESRNAPGEQSALTIAHVSAASVQLDDQPPEQAAVAAGRVAGAGADLCQAWLDVLDHVERGKEPPLAEREYGVVHRHLLRTLREADADDSKRPHRERLITLVEPWVSLHALCSVDASTLHEVTDKCRQEGSRLGLLHRSAPLWPWLIAIALAALAAVAGFLVLGAR